MNDKFLYRALRQTEIKRRVFIPKIPLAPFVDSPRFPQVFPLRFGDWPEHAVRAQQWDSDRFPTSGVSTAPHLKQAKYYAQQRLTIVCPRLAYL